MAFLHWLAKRSSNGTLNRAWRVWIAVTILSLLLLLLFMGRYLPTAP